MYKNEINLKQIPHQCETGIDKDGNVTRHITIEKEELEKRGIFPNQFARDVYVLIFSDNKTFGCTYRNYLYNQDETGKITTTKGKLYHFGIWYHYNFLTILK